MSLRGCHRRHPKEVRLGNPGTLTPGCSWLSRNLQHFHINGHPLESRGWTSARSPYPSINVAGYRCPCRALCWLLRVSGWRSFGLRVADLFDLSEDGVACPAKWRVRPCRWRAWVQVAATVTERRRAAQRRRVVGGCPDWSPSFRTSDLRGSHRETHRTPSARGLEPPRGLAPRCLLACGRLSVCWPNC